MEIRGLIDFIAKTSASIEAFATKSARLIKNEVTDLIDAVVKGHGRLQLPIMSGKYLRKVSHRERLQDPEQMLSFIDEKGITNFDELQNYLNEHGAVFDKLDADLEKGNARVKELKAKILAWERYEPFLKVRKQSKSLKGFAKLKFDKENKAVLDAFPEEVEKLRRVVPEGEPIVPKVWQKEIYDIIGKQFPIEDKMSAEVHDIAYAEVFKYNKGNEEREHANDRSAKEHERSRSRKHSYYER